MARNGHNAKAIAHAKYPVWVKKENCLKHTKYVSTNTFELFSTKNGSKKQLIFEKWEHFENGQKWPQCKGYSPCKILSLGQKIKLLKTREIRLYKHIRAVLLKKRLEKTANIQKKGSILKMAESGHNTMTIAHAKYPIWVKKENSLWHVKKVSTNTLELFYAKWWLEKQLIFEKWEHFENGQKWPKLATKQGYSPCKKSSIYIKK